MLSQERVRSLFCYEPITGILKRRVSGGGVVAGTVSGCLRNDGYVSVGMDDTSYLSHRVIWVYVHGDIKKGVIDHINGDRADNRLENLRDVTPKTNQQNRAMQKNNVSGITGVRWATKDKMWIATIANRSYIGMNKDFFEACCLRKSAELKLNYHANHGRST